MTGGPDIDLDVVIGERVGGPADLIPVVEPEGEVVQAAIRSRDDGQIVGRMRALEPDAQLVAVAVEQLLGQPEAEHVRIEMGSIANLLGRYQHVIEARRSDAFEILRPR